VGQKSGACAGPEVEPCPLVRHIEFQLLPRFDAPLGYDVLISG